MSSMGTKARERSLFYTSVDGIIIPGLHTCLHSTIHLSLGLLFWACKPVCTRRYICRWDYYSGLANLLFALDDTSTEGAFLVTMLITTNIYAQRKKLLLDQREIWALTFQRLKSAVCEPRGGHGEQSKVRPCCKRHDALLLLVFIFIL